MYCKIIVMYATNKAVGIMAGSIILNVTTFSITILNYYFKSSDVYYFVFTVNKLSTLYHACSSSS